MSATTERDFTIVGGLPGIKERNAAKRELEAEGWNVETGGYKGNYRVEAWKGEKPTASRTKISLLHGTVETTPLYRRADGQGWEYMDGTPEGMDDD